MGKTSSWLRSLLIPKKDKKETYPNNRNSPILIPQPTSKERRRWSFRRSSASSKDKNSNPNQWNAVQFSETQIDKTKNTPTIEDTAATRIQSAFRSYLARKALFALRGLVKLQALVRGHLVRKRATATLRCMQALMTAQARARAQRLRMADDSKSSTPRHFFQGKYYRYENERGMEENIKIVEVDLGHVTSQQKDRIQSHFDGYYSSTTAQSSPKLHSPAPSRHDLSKPSPNFGVESQAPHDNPFYPNYMANTESSRAKARSQSAPKTRPPDWVESQQSRRRVSLEGRHCPRPVRSMQRSSSQAGYGAQNYENPWGVKLGKSSVSLKDSECGSTSTALSTIYCRSLAAYDTHGNPSPWLHP